MEGGNSSCSYLHILVLIFFFLASKLYATNITINQKVVVVGSLVNIFSLETFQPVDDEDSFCSVLLSLSHQDAQGTSDLCWTTGQYICKRTNNLVIFTVKGQVKKVEVLLLVIYAEAG